VTEASRDAHDHLTVVASVAGQSFDRPKPSVGPLSPEEAIPLSPNRLLGPAELCRKAGKA
jgi:hypothetical protein